MLPNCQQELSPPNSYSCVIFVVTGTLGLCGNLWVIIVILTSKSMRKKLINILFTSQSCLDFSCGLLLILTCRDKTFAPSVGHFGIAGNYVSFLDSF